MRSFYTAKQKAHPAAEIFVGTFIARGLSPEEESLHLDIRRWVCLQVKFGGIWVFDAYGDRTNSA
jgi:hypothetical protein